MQTPPFQLGDRVVRRDPRATIEAEVIRVIDLPQVDSAGVRQRLRVRQDDGVEFSGSSAQFRLADYSEERLEELADEAVAALRKVGLQFSNETGIGADLMQDWTGENTVRNIEVRVPSEDGDEWGVLVTSGIEYPDRALDFFPTLSAAVAYVVKLSKKPAGPPVEPIDSGIEEDEETDDDPDEGCPLPAELSKEN